MPTAGISTVAPIGKRFGTLTVVSESMPGPSSGSSQVICRCDCGDERRYYIGNLAKMKSAMCPDCRPASHPAKGFSGKHPLFNIWKAMIQRCENPNHTWYKRYGGRGIAMCRRWRDDFEAFAADMGERPSPKHTVDRIDGDRGYEPGNVRWAVPVEQQRNRSDSHRIEWQGRTICGKEAAELAGIEVATFYYRLKAGWSIDRIMTTPSTMTKLKGVPKPKPPL